MASSTAFELGWQSGRARNARRRERKEGLEDEERKQRVSDLYDKGHSLAKLIPSMTGEDRTKAMSDLTDIEQSIHQIYHPDSNPGALQKDWHWLANLVTKKPPPKPVVSTRVEAGIPAETFTMGGERIDMPAAPSYTAAAIAPTAMTPTQRRIAALRNEAAKRAGIDVAAAGLSPEQEAGVDSRKKLAYLRQAQKDFEATYPDATREQKQQFLNELRDKTYGITEKPVWKEFIGPNAEKQWFDVNRQDEIPAGWNATGTESADTRTRADFDAYRREHPDYRGSLQQWKVEQSQLGKLAVPTNRDDRYIAIEQKRALGQPLSKDDQAYGDAYDMYVKKRVTGPMLARVAAQAEDRYVQVMDFENPEKVVLMRAGDAARAGAGTPQSIGFQTDKSMSKYMTSGKGGENLVYFNTAVDHLKLLNEVADALNNGDIQKLNQYGNAFATATGGEAPTDFEAIKSAVVGELAKTFSGKGATVEEIGMLNQVINQAQSPDQIHGAIRYYLRAMDGRMAAMRQQWESAKQNKPPFAPPSGGGGGTKTYKHYATNPQNHHRIGTDDDPQSPSAKWYDSENGKPVQ